MVHGGEGRAIPCADQHARWLSACADKIPTFLAIEHGRALQKPPTCGLRTVQQLCGTLRRVCGARHASYGRGAARIWSWRSCTTILIHIGPEFLAALLPVCGAHPSCSTCQSATSRKTCTDVTMACARPDRDPEMLALYHIPPLGPARGPFQRSRGAGGVPRGVDLIPPPIRSTPPGTPERTCAARARPRCLAHLSGRTRTRAFRAAQPSCRRSSASWTDVFMAARQHWRSRSLTALRFAWYWKDHPLSSRLETPHEPPKRCGLTPSNLRE